ncbi:MAG TPA: single-stranded-DNA-specific exonuclease RecJ [Magnetospirillaceae bacterium]|nr:single-stranded-DNA-specific exonuclease RecJ [Magnetospirillaceae bacterium]
MKWHKKDVSPAAVKEIAVRFDLDLLAASVLARRGITAPGELLYFVEDDLRYLHNPFLFEQMEDAVDRVLQARDEGEKILVFGDRDADGITSTVLVYRALEAKGMDVRYRLPSEDEPYGLSRKAVEDFAADFGTLIITVDCGISNHAEIDLARELGVDVIVLDHHIHRRGELPGAVAVVDPKIEGCGYPFRDLAGCGVAYKFVRALAFAESWLYKQQVALLNVRPANDSYTLEAVRLSNLVETGRLSETIVPGMVELGKTRLLPFLSDQQIFVWDGELQRRLLDKAFGRAVEFQFHDIAADIAELIPSVRGKSLPRLREQSRIARYSEQPAGEIDVLASLFVSFALRKTAVSEEEDLEALQLVAVGTLADLMPLRNENRILVRKGIAALNAKPRAGLAELLARLNLAGRRLAARDIAWQLTPAINATGRMGSPETAVRLFLGETSSERTRLAEDVIAMNQDRRKLGSEGWEAVLPDARKSLEAHDGKLVLVGRDDVNRGITGIIAARLSNTLRVPAVVAAFLGGGTIVGSLRSLRGFPVKELLELCSDLFIDYGGHDQAAGFSLPADSWDELARRIRDFTKAVELETEDESLVIDAELPHSYMKPEITDLVDRFEPYGEENGPLLFLSRDVPITSLELVGKREQNHVKLLLDFGQHRWPALFWSAAERVERDFSRTDRLDIVFQVGRNYWNGMEQTHLVIKDARRTGENGTPLSP